MCFNIKSICNLENLNIHQKESEIAKKRNSNNNNNGKKFNITTDTFMHTYLCIFKCRYRINVVLLMTICSLSCLNTKMILYVLNWLKLNEILFSRFMLFVNFFFLSFFSLLFVSSLSFVVVVFFCKIKLLIVTRVGLLLFLALFNKAAHCFVCKR